MENFIELGIDRVARSAGAGAVRAADLDHEVFDDSVENDSVVVADFRQTDDVSGVTRCDVRVQIEQHFAGRRFCRVGIVVSEARHPSGSGIRYVWTRLG